MTGALVAGQAVWTVDTDSRHHTTDAGVLLTAGDLTPTVEVPRDLVARQMIEGGTDPLEKTAVLLRTDTGSLGLGDPLPMTDTERDPLGRGGDLHQTTSTGRVHHLVEVLPQTIEAGVLHQMIGMLI